MWFEQNVASLGKKKRGGKRCKKENLPQLLDSHRGIMIPGINPFSEEFNSDGIGFSSGGFSLFSSEVGDTHRDSAIDIPEEDRKLIENYGSSTEYSSSSSDVYSDSDSSGYDTSSLGDSNRVSRVSRNFMCRRYACKSRSMSKRTMMYGKKGNNVGNTSSKLKGHPSMMKDTGSSTSPDSSTDTSSHSHQSKFGFCKPRAFGFGSNRKKNGWCNITGSLGKNTGSRNSGKSRSGKSHSESSGSTVSSEFSSSSSSERMQSLCCSRSKKKPRPLPPSYKSTMSANNNITARGPCKRRDANSSGGGGVCKYRDSNSKQNRNASSRNPDIGAPGISKLAGCQTNVPGAGLFVRSEENPILGPVLFTLLAIVMVIVVRTVILEHGEEHTDNLHRLESRMGTASLLKSLVFGKTVSDKAVSGRTAESSSGLVSGLTATTSSTDTVSVTSDTNDIRNTKLGVSNAQTPTVSTSVKKGVVAPTNAVKQIWMVPNNDPKSGGKVDVPGKINGVPTPGKVVNVASAAPIMNVDTVPAASIPPKARTNPTTETMLKPKPTVPHIDPAKRWEKRSQSGMQIDGELLEESSMVDAVEEYNGHRRVAQPQVMDDNKGLDVSEDRELDNHKSHDNSHNRNHDFLKDGGSSNVHDFLKDTDASSDVGASSDI